METVVLFLEQARIGVETMTDVPVQGQRKHAILKNPHWEHYFLSWLHKTVRGYVL